MTEYLKRVSGPLEGPISTSQVTVRGTAITDGPTFGGEFLDGDNWTSTGWTGSWDTGWTHTTGNTDVLSHDHAASSSVIYKITYTVSGRTAGTFTITFGGKTSSNISSSGVWVIKTTSTGVLQITPTTDFDGTIIISINALTASTSPTVEIYNSSGDKTLEIRAIKSTDNNIFIGNSTGPNNVTGYDNVFMGASAGSNNITGQGNVFIGRSAGYNNQYGNLNVFIGKSAGYGNQTGSQNIYIGDNAGSGLSSGNSNIIIGHDAGRNNTGGYENVYIGMGAAFSSSSGYYNTFVGGSAGNVNTSGYHNTFIGCFSGAGNTTGNQNTYIGLNSGRSVSTGAYNTFIGHYAGHNSYQLSSILNSTGLGNGAFTTRNNQVVIGNHNVVETQLRANVYIGSTSTTDHTQPTAKLHIAAGSATANTAPLKFTSGTLLTTPEAGAIEFDGNDFYVTIGSTRYRLVRAVDRKVGTGASVTAGNTYVDVTHNLASTPTTVRVTPTSNLGGRSFWVSDKGSSTFRINIDSTDIINHTFDWEAEV